LYGLGRETLEIYIKRWYNSGVTKKLKCIHQGLFINQEQFGGCKMCKFNLLRISVLVSLILLCLTASFGQDEKKRRPSMADLFRQSMENKKGRAAGNNKGVHEEEFGAEDEELEQELEEKQVAAEIVDPNKPKDPLDSIEREGKNEMREWIYGKQEDRIALAKRAQDQVTAELNYIRKVAEAEGAKQTIEAIDKVIANRKERFDRIAQRIRQERAKAAQNQDTTNTRQNVRGRGSTGTGRGGGATTGRGQIRGQQDTGTRGRMPQGQDQQSTRGRQNGY
jgi:hypothetical protein